MKDSSESDSTWMEASNARRTALVSLGRGSDGFVNPPVHRTSTVTFKTLDEFERALSIDLLDGPFTYGLLDTPTERSLAKAIADLDGGEGAILVESGLAAVGVSLLAFLKTGDHLTAAFAR